MPVKAGEGPCADLEPFLGPLGSGQGVAFGQCRVRRLLRQIGPFPPALPRPETGPGIRTFPQIRGSGMRRLCRRGRPPTCLLPGRSLQSRLSGIVQVGHMDCLGHNKGSSVMSLQVIGAGVGRTGTYSLKLALNQLGLGPCHHMEEVLHKMESQVPLWSAATAGDADWATIYDGYQSAVDWPTTGFFRELNATNPGARFILTVRSPQSWAASFSSTIYKLLAEAGQAPAEMTAWLAMADAVITKTGFPRGLDVEDLEQAFTAHIDAVKATIPAERLLVFQVKDGWEPLCAFLDLPVPDGPFPRTNDRGEFWDRVTGKI